MHRFIYYKVDLSTNFKNLIFEINNSENSEQP